MHCSSSTKLPYQTPLMVFTQQIDRAVRNAVLLSFLNNELTLMSRHSSWKEIAQGTSCMHTHKHIHIHVYIYRVAQRAGSFSKQGFKTITILKLIVSGFTALVYILNTRRVNASLCIRDDFKYKDDFFALVHCLFRVNSERQLPLDASKGKKNQVVLDLGSIQSSIVSSSWV